MSPHWLVKRTSPSFPCVSSRESWAKKISFVRGMASPPVSINFKLILKMRMCPLKNIVHRVTCQSLSVHSSKAAAEIHFFPLFLFPGVIFNPEKKKYGYVIALDLFNILHNVGKAEFAQSIIRSLGRGC